MPFPPKESPRTAAERYTPQVYDELRRLAGRYLRGDAGATLEPTSLVHEAFLRLAEERRNAFENRTHFFRVAAQAMRRALIDHVRERRAQKRGGGELRVTLTDRDAAQAPLEVDVLALEQALTELERLDPQQARIVELRFLAGLTVEETAQTLGLSTPTVKRDWAHARAWLRLALSPEGLVDGR